jgi:hypothetical protein
VTSGYDFQVAVSFADEDREYVSRVVASLRGFGVSVFYDADHSIDLWGKDLAAYCDEVYRQRSQFVVIFVSRYYITKQWTRHELRSALARALDEKKEYVLPARFDDADVPGLPPTVRHVDCRSVPPEGLAQMILQKIVQRIAASPAGAAVKREQPVRRSHDVAEMSARAEERTQLDPRARSPQVVVAVAFGPTQQVTRPSVLGDNSFSNKLMQRATFGKHAVLTPGEQTETRMRGDFLTLAQANALISMDELATIEVRQPAVPPHTPGVLSAVIDDIVRAAIERSLRLAVEVVGDLDQAGRLTHMLPVVALLRTGSRMPWRTAAEHAASPNRMTLNVSAPGRIVVRLRDLAIALTSLPGQIEPIAEDLTALIARQMLQS